MSLFIDHYKDSNYQDIDQSSVDIIGNVAKAYNIQPLNSVYIQEQGAWHGYERCWSTRSCSCLSTLFPY